MKHQAENIVHHALQHLFQRFQQQTLIRKLLSHIVQYNLQYHQRITTNCVNKIYMKSQPIKKNSQFLEDAPPETIKVDEYSNCCVGSVDSVDQKSIVNRDFQQNNNSSAVLERRTGSTFRGSSSSFKKSRQGKKINLQKYFVVPPFDKKKAVQLPEEKPTEDEIQFQLSLRSMQKRLYYSRRMKKKYDEEEKIRIQELKRRKSPPKPKYDFTYSFTGQLLEKKVKEGKQFDVSEMKASQSFQDKNKKKVFNGEEEEDDSESLDTSHMNTRYRKTGIFNNYNKRQVSHLPFIKMSENVRISESHKTNQGSKTERTSLKEYIQQNQHNAFKHYNQIEKERKQKERYENLKQLQPEEDKEKNLQGKTKITEQSIVTKRQSMMMNRYLKKLKQQQETQNSKVSVNFDRTHLPQTQSIHRYYKHNYNQDRKSYESQVFSRVLDS